MVPAAAEGVVGDVEDLGMLAGHAGLSRRSAASTRGPDEAVAGRGLCDVRHSFWAGLAAPSLPPQPFEPVGVAFVTGSISTFGFVETLEHTLAPDHPLRALYLTSSGRGGRATSEPAIDPALSL